MNGSYFKLEAQDFAQKLILTTSNPPLKKYFRESLIFFKIGKIETMAINKSFFKLEVWDFWDFLHLFMFLHFLCFYVYYIYDSFYFFTLRQIGTNSHRFVKMSIWTFAPAFSTSYFKMLRKFLPTSASIFVIEISI